MGKELTMIKDRLPFDLENGIALPTVRIKSIEIKDVKNVSQGNIDFDCAKEFIPAGTRSDVLGVYGQNGSGKTTLIEAMKIIRDLLCGFDIIPEFADCIKVDAKCSTLKFVFELQYDDGRLVDATYECKLKKELNEKKTSEVQTEIDEDKVDYEFKVVIMEEQLLLAGDFGGKRIRKQLFLKSSNEPESEILEPKTKVEQIFKNDATALSLLAKEKILAESESRSFLFSDALSDSIKAQDGYSELHHIINSLKFYAFSYLYVLSTKSTGLIRMNVGIPIYTRFGVVRFYTDKPTFILKERIDEICTLIANLSGIIKELVPGLSLKANRLGQPGMKTDKKGREFEGIELNVVRGDYEYPIRYESDGIRKIISELALYTAAYNDRSCTVAIDEFDAGIYEYLLGELIGIMEESGKGQFIFTSHNLRPLEVLNKKHICFTTTNPDNRYIKVKYIKPTNNLRSLYFREIMLGGCMEESIYNETKRTRIVSALRHAGVNADGEEE